MLITKDFKFKINNHEWKVIAKDEKNILDEYHKRQPNAYCCMGLTLYKEHEIWIAKDICEDEKMRTLIHELTHCYIWEQGFYNVDFNNEELVCDFVASISSFINEIKKKLSYNEAIAEAIECEDEKMINNENIVNEVISSVKDKR